MPIRRRGESKEAAREREVGRREAEPRVERRAVPERGPAPPGQEFGEQRIPETERREVLRRKEEQRPIPPKAPSVPEFNFKFWEPRAPTSLIEAEEVDVGALQTAAFKGEPLPAPEFDPLVEVANEVSQFVEWNESVFDNVTGLPPDPIAGASDILDMGPSVPLTGRQGEIMDASLNMFWAYKNLEEYLRQYTEYDPETVKNLGKQGTDSSRIHAGTLNPTKALWDSLEAINEEHPDTYTAYLSTDAGREELFSNALMRMFSIPTGEWSILAPGASAGEAIDKNMPNVPILKDSIVNTVEIAGDPIFIGATVAFPPAGASRLALGASMAAGMGVGEEVAEEVGAPGIVGALVGGIAGPTAVGFTRAAMRAALRRSRHFPVRGEPATEMLVGSGEIPGDLRALRQQTGESVGPPGTVLQEVKLSPAEVKQGRHTVQALDDSGAELGKLQWREPAVAEEGAAAHVSDVVVQTERQGVGTALMQDLVDESAARGIGRIIGDLDSEAGIRLFSRFGAKLQDLKGKVLSQDDAIVALSEGKGITGEIAVPKLPATTTARGVAPPLFHGTSTERGIHRATDVGNVQGVFLTSDRDIASGYARGAAEAGGQSEVISLRLKPGQRLLRTDSAEWAELRDLPRGQLEAEIKRRGYAGTLEPDRPIRGSSAVAQEVVVFDPANLERTTAKVVSEMAGGATGPNIQNFRTAIAAHIERPEARDLLRFTAGKVADTVPLGVGRRVQEIVNRLAVADAPELKAAFGWQFQKASDDAARFMAFAKFRGTKTPFIENEIGQVWVPTIAGKGRRTPGNLFRRGEGEWVGARDVFEGILRGDQKFLSRVTAEQSGFVKELDATLNEFIRFAEINTGMKIAKRDVWFPSMVIDPVTKTWRVGGGTGRSRPSALMARQFEVQQEALTQFGIKYKPGVVNVAEQTAESFQRMGRDALMGKYMKEEDILRTGKPRFGAGETYATDISASIRGVVSKTHAREINTIIGPASKNPVVAVPAQINAIARMMLTGTMDAGWGSLQLVTLMATPAGPAKWAEAMARGFYNAAIEPKQFYRFMAKSKAAQRYSLYAGDMGFSSEMMEAARIGGIGLPRIPGVSPVIDVATFPARAFVNRLMVGFDASLAYGRIFAFDGLAEVASKPGLLLKAQGIKPLAGKELHEEMFRIARFADTLIGQPKLGGVISAPQHQIESAFMWFATRYTRSFLGTASYMLGRGYTPAQARIILSKLLVGGMASVSGLIAAKGAATGRSQEEVLNEIEIALNPQSGKKFMSMKMGKDWYGLGGVYRSMTAAIAGLSNKENWEFESWEEGLYDNPVVQMWRSRTTPITSTLIDFLEGEDFLGYGVNFWDFVDHPEKAGDYAVDKFAPISADALLQDGSVQRKTQRFAAEFFGLRTSPETAWEALEPVMNQVSLYKFGIPYEGLENNLPAQDWIRNHPNVVAVTEGDVRPIREREREKFWREYREGREAIRDTHIPTRTDIENAYTSGRMGGSDYREQYGESKSAEYFELKGYQHGLDVDFDSGEEDEAPAGSVDKALGDYYEIDLDDYRDKDTRVPDWEAFFADRDAALAQVPDEFEELVEQWINRRETEVRRHMRSRFEEVVETSGYFRARENVAVSLEINLDDLEAEIVQSLQKEEKRATPADVSRIVDKILNGSLDATLGEDAPSISVLRQLMRETNPTLDAELFRQGFVDTVRSVEAQGYLVNYMKIFPDMGYFEAPLASDVKDRLEKEAEE